MKLREVLARQQAEVDARRARIRRKVAAASIVLQRGNLKPPAPAAPDVVVAPAPLPRADLVRLATRERAPVVRLVTRAGAPPVSPKRVDSLAESLEQLNRGLTATRDELPAMRDLIEKALAQGGAIEALRAQTARALELASRPAPAAAPAPVVQPDARGVGLATQALKQIQDLGIVVRGLEQRGMTVFAHLSDGNSTQVIDLSVVVRGMLQAGMLGAGGGGGMKRDQVLELIAAAGGGVTSVNGDSGPAVTLDAADVGADPAGAAAAAVGAHEAAGDPHPQYLTSVEADLLYDALGATAAAVAAHLAAGDPHPQYLTPAEGDAVYALLDHHARHENGGPDEINVAGLSGLLADAQKVTVRKNTGADVGTRKRLNLIEGANITLTIADDAGGDEVDITIAAAAGGSMSATSVDIPFTDGDTLRRVTIVDAAVTASSKIVGNIIRPDQASEASDKGFIYVANVVRRAAGAFDVLVACLNWGYDDPVLDPPNETVKFVYAIGA